MATPNTTFFPTNIAGAIQDLSDPTLITGQAFSYPESVLRVIASWNMINMTRQATTPGAPTLWDLWDNPASLSGTTITDADLLVWDGTNFVDPTPGHFLANMAQDAVTNGITIPGISSGTLDINSLTAEATLDAANDTIPFYDASAGANRKATIASIAALAGLDINGLAAATLSLTDEIAIYDVSGGTNGKATIADIAAFASLDITGLTAETTVDAANDSFVFYDASATANRKITAQATIDALITANALGAAGYLQDDGTGVKSWVPYTWTTGTQPGTPVTGQTGYNSTTSSFEGWNGAAWVSMGGGTHFTNTLASPPTGMVVGDTWYADNDVLYIRVSDAAATEAWLDVSSASAGGSLDITGLAAVTLATTDEIPVYDVSGAVNGKATIADITALSTFDINALTAVTLDVSDEIAVYDVSGTASGKATISDVANIITSSDDFHSDLFFTGNF